MIPLYRGTVALGRDPSWYLQGGVPDSQDGRFDMIAAVLGLVLLRLEQDGQTYASQSALLTELFIDDMDGQLRELGIGDVVVGKHIGKMMGALGGRLAAYRAGFVPGGDMREALLRNLYRGESPEETELAYTTSRLEGLAMALASQDPDALIAGALPDLA